MANGIDTVSVWHFIAPGQLTPDVQSMLVPGEQVHAVYKTMRDTATFTNKRLIVRDAQGITGKKVEIFSLPWSAVQMWSSENAGRVFDIDTEIELWTLVGHFKINLRKSIDIREVDRLIAAEVLK